MLFHLIEEGQEGKSPQAWAEPWAGCPTDGIARAEDAAISLIPLPSGCREIPAARLTQELAASLWQAGANS
jgi:hypothetical protein